MNHLKAVAQVCLALTLAACGGDQLSVDQPEQPGPPRTLQLSFTAGQAVEHRLTFRISGGIPPYTSSIEGCPDWVTLFPDQGVLAGTAPADAVGTFFCTYRVTESDPGFRPQRSVSYGLRLEVTAGATRDPDAWRFRTRTVEPGGPCVRPGGATAIGVATLPAAHGGQGTDSYALPGAPHPLTTGRLLSFNPSNRVLTYANPEAPPVLGTPDTYRYLVGTAASVNAENAEDALCLDVRYDTGAGVCPENLEATPPVLSSQYIHILLQVRDDAFWDESAGEYRCPDTNAPTPPPATQGSSSNPVHEALGPVHARRAAAVAHAAVRDRVRGWSPGAEQASFAIAPEVGVASLSGQSAGFDYSGSSESASVGAETGAGAWQAGVVASFTRTELRYRAEAALAERGYRTGDHDTELASLHPFAAWHAPSGGHIWASLGTGAGSLNHRDDLGFPSWSRSDVGLFAYAAGASVPVADVLSGELQAEAGIESFALDIEGGGRISSSLPTLQGRDWRAGLAWSAPVYGAPSVSMAYRHLTGDGPEGGRLEARGSVSVEGMFNPRLTLTGSAEGSLGVGEYEHDSWGLAGGVRFAPGKTIRGFGLEFDTRLASPDERGSADVGMRGEVGYGLSGGPFFGTLRPHVGLIRYSGDGSLRRSFGVDLRDTPSSRAKLEVYDRTRDGLRALEFTLDHRF